MFGLLHKILYRLLPLKGYLRVVSRLFFLWHGLGLGRRSAALEYVYHLPRLVREGDVCIDIGANLGYYARTLSKLVGPSGRVYAVEPVAPIREVMCRNLRRCANTWVIPYALGGRNRPVWLANDTVRKIGYLGTGRNSVKESSGGSGLEFPAEMRRGSELFGGLERLDFIKCDVEGYEEHIMSEMLPVLERHHPTVLIETEDPDVVRLFTELGYAGFTLDGGREVPLADGCRKDIIFRYQK